MLLSLLGRVNAANRFLVQPNPVPNLLTILVPSRLLKALQPNAPRPINSPWANLHTLSFKLQLPLLGNGPPFGLLLGPNGLRARHVAHEAIAHPRAIDEDGLRRRGFSVQIEDFVFDVEGRAVAGVFVAGRILGRGVHYEAVARGLEGVVLDWRPVVRSDDVEVVARCGGSRDC